MCAAVLPERTDQIFRVPRAEEQAGLYDEQNNILAALMRKWERQGWLSDIDRKRVLCSIQNMRMLCNSTFLFDKQTNHSPKLKEFREILHELAIVHVINMLTGDSIEERVWETLRLKKSIFASVFDSSTAEVSFAKLGRKTGLEP